MLLDVLETLVNQDRGPPGFEGIIAIGLIGDPPRWWTAVANGSIKTRFSTSMPEKYDVAVLLNAESTARMLGLEDNTSDTGTRIVTGDETLLERFMDRYVRHTDMIAFRAKAQAK